MKKIFIFCMMALVAMCGLNSCSDDCDHNFAGDDHSADLVGTWTCLQEGFAEALVIKADGSVVSTGVAFGEYWENVAGNFVIENGKVTMTFEDHDNYEGHIDVIPGIAFSVYNDKGRRFTYNYCKEDLSDKVVGMWVCNDLSNGVESNMAIETYKEDGTLIFTGVIPNAEEYMVNLTTSYKVVGDLLFTKRADASATSGEAKYISARLNYTSNGTTLGDILTFKQYLTSGNNAIETISSWLRIKQGLNLTGKAYAYSTAYVSNAKGTDEEFSILGHPFNMANIKTANFDMLFHSELFCAVLKENSFKQLFRANGQDIEVEIPITVEGNKVTLDMSAEIPACRKVDMYMFQDANDSQLHIYMHTDAFINYFANMQLYTLMAQGKIDLTDTAAVEKVFTDMEARVESINVSFVMKAIE